MKNIYRNIPKMWRNHPVYWYDIRVLVPRVIQPYNESLAKSIEEEGMKDPLILGKVDNKGNIVVGNQRFTILTKLGVQTVPIVWLNLSDFHRFETKRGRYRHGNPKKYIKLLRKHLNNLVRDQFFV